MGHFHVHQKMDYSVCYPGSPLQFNFGDCGDARGVMVYDVEKDTDEFFINPFYDAFRVIAYKDIDSQLSTLKDTFVTVIYDDMPTDDQITETTEKLKTAGVLQVRKESVVEQAIREHVVEVDSVKAASAADLVEPFVKSVLTGDSQIVPEVAVQFGKAIINEVNAGFQNVSADGAIFDGDIVEITMENFFGIHEPTTIRIDQLRNGIWYFEGENGAGKSTILEAICWCYFGETIRDGMKVDEVVWDPKQTGKGKNCSVMVKHANGWSIKRFRKHADLGGSGVKVFKGTIYQEDFQRGDPRATQEKINELLGIDYSTFTRGVIMGQNLMANFVTGGEKERRAMIENMLGLERFDSYLEKVREIKKTLVEQLEQQDQIQRLRSGEVARTAEQIQQIDTQILDAEKAHQTKLNKAAQTRVDYEAMNAKAKTELEFKEGIIANALQKAKAEHEVVSKQYQQATAGRGEVEAKIATARAEIQRWNGLIGSITDAVLARNNASTELLCEVNTAKANLVVLTKNLDEMKVFLGRKAELETATKARDALLAEAAQMDQKVSACTASQSSSQERISIAKRKLEELRGTKVNLACPTCCRTLDEESLRAAIASFTESVTKLSEERAVAGVEKERCLLEAKRLRDEAARKLIGVPSEGEFVSASLRKTTFEQGIAENEKFLAMLPVTAKNIVETFEAQMVKILPPGETRGGDPDPILGDLRLSIHANELQIEALQRSTDQTTINQATQALQKAQEALNAAEGAQSTIQREKSALEAGNAAGMAAMTREEQALRASDPAGDLQAVKVRLINGRSSTMEELENAKRVALSLNQKQAYVVFWDRAFAAKGSMRAFLLDQSIKQLNMVISGYIDQHFDGNMKLSFNSDLTTKESYGRRSGGQRKWTDLAILFSLFELVMQRCRYRSKFLALDEVFDALSTSGRQAVLDIIQIMASRIPHIFVITHVEITGAARAGTIQATMVDDCTSYTVKPC